MGPGAAAKVQLTSETTNVRKRAVSHGTGRYLFGFSRPDPLYEGAALL